MTIQSVARMPSRVPQFGDTSKKPPGEESPVEDGPSEPSTPSIAEDTVSLGPEAEDVVQDVKTVEETLQSRFSIDREKVDGFLNKARVLMANLLGLEDPENASWFDVVIKVAQLVIDAATNGKTPKPGTA